jgi:hypothetical protein
MTALASSRQPTWSDVFTEPLAAFVPAARRDIVLRAIKVFHTAAFAAISGAIVVFAWEGLHGRRGPLAGASALIAIGETLVFTSNNQVCPLTPLAEQLGASSGTVTDIYLPAWISRRVPMLGGSVLLIGVVAHAVAWVKSRGGATSTWDHDHGARRSPRHF